MFATSTIDIPFATKLDMQNNVFEALAHPSCALQAPGFEISYSINAIHNYWGSKNLSEIVNTICGFEKNMGLSYVSYIPYYGDNMLTQLTSPENFNKSSAHGTFGGEITRNTQLAKSDFPIPILIQRSIVIRPGVSLYVETGVELRFLPYRGIYVQGSLKSIGENSSVRLTNAIDGHIWYGVIINGTSSLENDNTLLFDTHISGTFHGVITYVPHFQIKRIFISNSSKDCFTIYPTVEKRLYSFESSILAHCRNNGLFVNGIGSSIIEGLEVRNSSTGVKVSSSSGQIELRTVLISNISAAAVSITYNSNSESGNVSITNCAINNSSQGVIIDISNYATPNRISITNNVFQNISWDVLHLRFSTYTYYNKRNRSVEIDHNTFTNSCGIIINTWNVEQTSFSNNVMKDSICNKRPECFSTITASGYSHTSDNRNYEISTNVFENIQSSSCIVHLLDSDLPRFNGAFIYNQLIDNKATDGVVLANAFYAEIVENIFDNPASTFDVFTTLKADRNLNVTKNWWGNSDGIKVFSRISDQRRDPGLARFNVTPTLASREMDCSGVNNCSNQGECVRKNMCRCTTGWTGPMCTEYDCAGINRCYGNGICVGPNECECNLGWSGKLCIRASCINVNDCSGHGFCIRPDTCTCAVSFTGSNCSSCVPLHWGQECRPCPNCKHGQCDLMTGLCVCNTDNWTGALCDKCSEAFYDPECLPLVTVLDVVPRQGIDKGGNTVHVWGHNFQESSSYVCKFGNVISNGTWKAWDHVVCVAPKHPEGVVTVEISQDGVHFTNNKIMYAFYASCPIEACGRNLNPPHGLCIFGVCSCILPWHGDNCTMELLRPVIARPPVPQAANEFDDYMLELGLTQGDQPVRWALLEGFKGLSLDERSGRVSWKSIPANINPYIFRVQASNTIGQDTVTWNLSVPISYVPFVNESDSNRILPYPRPVQISGYINFTSKVKMVPVMIVVINARTGEQTVLNEWSNPLKPSVFTTTYYPKADESGLFNVIARHPGSRSDLGPQISWSVLGMQCIPPSVNVDETILSPDGTVTVYNISELLNVGEYNINNILIKVDGIEDTFIKRNVDNVIAVADIAVLKPRDPFLFDLVIRNARPLYGTIYIVFASDHGTTTRLRINIRLSIQKPVLSFLPNSISANILRGTQRFFNIGIKNIGKVAATNIDISLPNDPRITLVSLSLVNSSEDVVTGDKLGIPPDGEAQMTFGVTIGSNAALGEFHGTIYVNSKLTSTPLQYEFFVTSLQRFNLTFTIKDEYTYFAEGSPLVSGAKVSLSNPRRQYAQTFYTTNETGYVVFENLYEDRYTFRAEADGHGSYSAVIIAGANETHRDIFLQRIAVKYTWTVTPTTFQDKYIIQLESTFETNVPMPVVTIEPSHINTIPYEIGEEDTINFKITNHGLIRANNVRFSLPEGHPYLKFKTVIDDIGSVEANTSIIVPIEATLKTRPKRNIVAAVICGLAMLYDYDCGALQTRAIDISLVRETPDGRPMPCGLSSGGGGRGVGGGISLSGGGANTGSGSSVEYSPTTPLSCDCAKTLIKSCALAYHPIIGCSYAITDLGLSYAKSNGDFILFTLYAILAIADTAMACVFGVICSLCGVMYTTVRCIGDVVDNCDVGRRRREISSDVVNNMMQTSKPIGNFLQIMSEFFGDEAMFDVETSWFQTFKQTVADDTDLGQMLSEQERTSIINFVKNETSKAIMSRFLERWNNTASAWNNGSLTELEDTGGVISLSRLKPKIQQYQTDTDAALAKGYANIFFQYDNASSVYKQAEEKERSEGGSKEDGVCARVRVRILQELVLTRDAFTARLEMENGENSDLQNIKVQIEIRPTYGSSANYIDKFSIGKPTLIGLSGVDGTGSLQKDTSGSAEWLIIPYSTAAPQDDTQYDVGGTLSYSVGGSEFALPLLPDTITVKPNPSLIVHYFHEKYVQGDNPMTQTVEPVVPFSLAVMVMNKGFGIARALKITSGQPEIIENDKGLLVSFEIIGAQMGSNSITPSLTVDFGDITSSQTKTARWLMTSSLMGKFYNYSATFENINPLGDPQLSLLDDLGYHELFHLVRIENADKDDGLDDFLVNDFIDIDDIPDRLYNSYSGLDVMAVTHANITNVTAPSFVRSMNKSYTNITIIIQKHVSNWIYSRLENTFRPNEKLIYAEAVDGHRPLLLQKNVWQTTYIKNKTLIHLFDYVSNSSNMSSDTTYQLTYGSENMYAPKFNMTSLVQEVRRVTPVGSTVLNVVTYDLDNDEIDILMMSNTTVFMIKKTSSSTASLTVVTPLNPGVFVIALLARDHGIPPKTSLANVSLTITDDINTTTPVFSSQSATSTTETSTVSSNASSTALKTATPSETITSTEPSTNVTIPTTDYTKDGSTRMSTTGEMSTSTNSNVSSSSTIAKTNATVSTTTTYQTTDTPTLSPTTHDLYTTRDPTGGNLSTSTKPSTTNATGTSSTSTESTSTKSVSTTQNISTTTGEFTTSNVFSVSTRSTNITSTVPNQGSVFAYSIVPTVIGCAVGVIVFWPLL
ncbi:hypothetical protein DPMN_105409 [Dreissena polymorpha]|uniref:Uncharacterized protein n=2 Tax=Dreissena polymorpha TaxID=45954 RepID=A0A9D4K337_DREPO|nr:hypothetical protein DPMN_105409 [Dreissena polymorpha]